MTQSSETMDGPATTPQDTRRAQRLSSTSVAVIAIYGLVVAMILLSRAVSPAFGGLSQVETIFYLAAFLVFCAFGQGLVILVRGLDLSIASLITLGGVLSTALMAGSNDGLFYILPAILLACALIGVVSGIGVTFFAIPPFIMTMAVGIIVYSLCLGFTQGTPRGFPSPLLRDLMQARLLAIPAPIWLLLAFVAVGTVLQGYSAFGRKLNAVGNNPEAAYVAGLSARTLTISAYAVSAACAGLTGILLAAYANGATLRMGDDYLLPSIAAVVVGGSSILGGRGSFLGTVGGALLLTTLATILSALGIGQGWKTILEGLVILVALIVLREQVFDALQAGLRGLKKG
ncbi:ABC transporter permease [Jiella sonneratiae]|uniref:Autoinducer 2 import system permease protein LsrD n=1 Tax=Jiella sonneratiae TaxID=2816856 RepID=A0ABS3J4X2_9HYPH|nr:ABC transporter permease [Jiella sonneratiae]MBO0904728.1 ABC transporter permease [Jiella sonneratiae]